MDMPRTIIHALQDRAAQLGDRPALWSKRQGTYLPTSWRDYAKRVKHFALGLISLGFKPGSTLGIMAFNREEWLVADLAAMAAGGVPVGLYTTSSQEQVRHILAHSEAEFLLVESARQAHQVLQLEAQLPHLRQVLLMDTHGGVPEGALAYTEVLARGAASEEGPYWARVNALAPDALATLIYTSGTTGEPKGVMLSHRNLVWSATKLVESLDLGEGERILSYLPLSHIAEQVSSLHAPVLLGAQVHFAESMEALPHNLREVRPTVFLGVPRVWEKFRRRAEEGLHNLPRQLAHAVSWARRVATQWHTRELEGESISTSLEAQYALARRLVFEPLHARLGFERTHLFITSAAPIAREVLEFFLSIDIVVREVYGQSEATGPTTVSTHDATQLGRLGRPMLGVEVRIAQDGEVLVRGGNVCMGYFKDPQGTAELLRDGWLHSGDVGTLDDEGYLRITGRKKELIVTSGGKKTAPAHLEGMLRAIEPLSHAVVVGEARPYLGALLALDPERTHAFCAQRGWPTAPSALARHEGFTRYLEEQISAQVNSRLSRFETLKRFAVLPRDLKVEEGELTPTHKVRRKVVEEHFAELVESLYSQQTPASPVRASAG
jgi:long-chain acyl-CoA synthetase